MVITMTLLAFQQQHYKQLIDWIDSAELNYLWGGPAYQYPLTVESIDAHCSQAEVKPFLYAHQGQVAGFVELYRHSNDIARICRVFVAPQFRGQGVAKTMLRALIREARSQGYSEITLCVFSHNPSAIRCYHSLGFVEVKREHGVREFDGESWELIHMVQKLQIN